MAWASRLSWSNPVQCRAVYLGGGGNGQIIGWQPIWETLDPPLVYNYLLKPLEPKRQKDIMIR